MYRCSYYRIISKIHLRVQNGAAVQLILVNTSQTLTPYENGIVSIAYLAEDKVGYNAYI